MKKVIVYLLFALTLISCDQEYINEIKHKDVKTVTVSNFNYKDGVLSTKVYSEKISNYDINGNLLEVNYSWWADKERIIYSYNGNYIYEVVDSMLGNDYQNVFLSYYDYNCDNDTCLCYQERVVNIMSSRHYLPFTNYIYHSYNELNQLTRTVYKDEEFNGLFNTDTSGIMTYYKNENGLDTLIIHSEPYSSDVNYKYTYDSHYNNLIEEHISGKTRELEHSYAYEYDDKGRISVKQDFNYTKYKYTYLSNDSIDYIDIYELSNSTGNFENYQKVKYAYKYFK
jgi:hypothetical protein